MVELKELQEALFRGDILKVKEITRKALWEKIEPKEILEQGLKREQRMILCYFLKREIVILAKVKKGGNKVNEFKRKTNRE